MLSAVCVCVCVSCDWQCQLGSAFWLCYRFYRRWGEGGGADETDGGSSDIWTNLIFLDIAEAFELCLVIRKTHFESKSSD